MYDNIYKCHKNKCSEFNKNKNNVDELIDNYNKINNELNNLINSDFDIQRDNKLYIQYDQQLESLREEIDDILNNNSEIKYYSNTADTFYNYHNLNNTTKDIDLMNKNFNDYIYHVNPSELKKTHIKIPICNICGSKQSRYIGDEKHECISCNNVYKYTSVINITNSCYNKNNYFNLRRKKVIACKKLKMPQELFKIIIDKYKVFNPEKIGYGDIKSYLKRTKKSKYNDDIPAILNELRGQSIQEINYEIEMNIRALYEKIIDFWYLHVKDDSQKNSLPINYVVRKIYELYDLKENCERHPYPEDPKNLYKLDKQWKLICDGLQLRYKRSKT